MLARILHRSNTAFQLRRYTYRPDTAGSAEISSKIATAFSENPELTGKQILNRLGPEERVRLLQILHSQTGTAVPEAATQAASRWVCGYYASCHQ